MKAILRAVASLLLGFADHRSRKGDLGVFLDTPRMKGRGMRGAICFLPVVLLGMAVPAHSAPIAVSAGDVVTFNFDFVASGVVPAPPYPFIQFEPRIAAFEPGDFGLWRGFSELDAGGSVIFGPHSVELLATLLTDSDGIFSMVLSVVTGSFTVDPMAWGFRDGRLVTDAVAPSSVTFAVAAVPEPATLALVCVGIAAAAWRRPRRNAL